MLYPVSHVPAKVEWKAPDVDGLVEFLVKQKGFKCVHALDVHR